MKHKNSEKTKTNQTTKTGYHRSGLCYSEGVANKRGRWVHGERVSNEARSLTYNSYRNMVARCFYPLHQSFKNYGGRGITVCDEWRGRNGYLNFLHDMGRRPSAEHTIDRRDNDGNYSPDNCQWLLRSLQAKNRRPRIIIINGEVFL